MSAGPLRLGVLGAGSWIFEQAIAPALAARTDVELVAASSRSAEPAAHWADVAVSTYEEVLAASEAVYLPLPNDAHLPWVRAAADAGVHVLCEKPLGLDATQAAAALAACDDAGVLLAEAWMTPFHPVGDAVAALVDEGAVGALLRVDTSFTFPSTTYDNYRWDAAHGGGALLDLGVYVLAPHLRLLDQPRVLTATARRRHGVDATTQAVLRDRSGVLGTATCSFEAPEQQQLVVTGTTGRLRVTQPFTPDEGVDHVELDRGDGAPQRLPVAGACDPYAAMLGAFADAVRGRAPWPRSPAATLALAALVDEVATAASS